MVEQMTVGLTGPDWKPTDRTRYFAQVNDSGLFAFGASPLEARNNLRMRLLDAKAERLNKLFPAIVINQ